MTRYEAAQIFLRLGMAFWLISIFIVAMWFTESLYYSTGIVFLIVICNLTKILDYIK